MKLQRINLTDLVVNQANDRHGELMSEDAAIEWLLTHKAQHMRNLAKDIVATREIYEPPLVRKENDHYVVYDGNRRTTALKLLAEPERAPSQDWAKYFTELRENWKGKFPTSIDCQVEEDRERLDEILYRRHTGQQSGVGQSQWDAPAKTNFERRTGKNSKIDVAEEIEKLLRTAGRLTQKEKIPRSNMKRLFSAEQFRNRAGIAVEKNKLRMTHNDTKVLDALERIAKDLISKKKTLDDLWDNAAKRKYLDSLAKEGVLPTVKDILLESKSVPPSQTPNPKPPSSPPTSPAPTPEKRHTLIRNVDFGIQQTHENRRVFDIFNELQHSLKFEEHDNAIAISFRVIIELSLELYISQKNVADVHKSDSLSKKFKKVLNHMLAEGIIDKKYHDSLKKFEHNEPILSSSTFNAYVHNADFFPSDHHLKGLWDTLERFVVICMKA